ncbi:MAG: penicillin-binding protein 2 [Pseudomonadota bacterium]
MWYAPGRLFSLKIVFVLLLLTVAGRAVQLNIFQGDFLKNQAERRYLRSERLAAYRGKILDREGKVLAVSTAVTSFWINPKLFLNDLNAQKLLINTFKLNPTEFQSRLKRYRDKEFMFIQRRLSEEEVKSLGEINISGLYQMPEYRRFYPAGIAAAHLVGMSDIEEHGQEGIELAYDTYLRGELGKRLVIKDRRGSVVKDLGIQTSARDGQDLQLSIDIRFQYATYQALEKVVTKNQAKAGTAVIVDVKRGEIIAMANYPSFDPNDRRKFDRSFLRNRALTDLFEPGSTMKPITAIAALESGLYNPDTKIETHPGYFPVGRKLIRDHRNYKTITLTQMLTKSSNVATTKIALALPPATLPELIYRFGFAQPLSLGYPGEQIGSAPGTDLWRPIEIATLSYGYGVSTNITQLAQAYAIIGNGGVRVPLTLFVRDNPPKTERVIDENVADDVLQMMETVISAEGTARAAGIKGYRVAGKTGTVHKLSAKGYTGKDYLSVFAGIAPVSKPRWAMAVMIDEPRGKAFYGGEVAAPVFAEVIAHMLHMEGVSPDETLHNVSEDISQPIDLEKNTIPLIP